MRVVSAVKNICVALAVATCLAGCWNGGESEQDELDPYVVKGKNLVKSLDYEGAVDAYNKALEVNPKSATAHFELFWLHENKVVDYPAAIYHAERYLRLRTNASNAEVVRQRILGCKQEIAKTLPVGPVTPALQRDFDRLNNENRVLRQQIEQLTQRLAFLSTNRPPQVQAMLTNVTTPVPAILGAAASRTAAPTAPTAPTSSTLRTHVVKPGETMAVIARKYNIRTTALQNANPGVDPRRMKAGQTLRVPPSN